MPHAMMHAMKIRICFKKIRMNNVKKLRYRFP